MKFKEFLNWCNDRACDGWWDGSTVLRCIDIIDDVQKQKWWHREKYWREKYKHEVVENIIKLVEERIKEINK